MELRDDVRDNATAVLSIAAEGGIDLLIYCTYRSDDDQARLYRRGRVFREIQAKADELCHRWHRPDLADVLMRVGPQDGSRIVTHAAPGQSAHGYRIAFDAVPIVDGKPVWGTDHPWEQDAWESYGFAVDAVGLDWSGRWVRRKREYAHAQLASFDWREWIR